MRLALTWAEGRLADPDFGLQIWGGGGGWGGEGGGSGFRVRGFRSWHRPHVPGFLGSSYAVELPINIPSAALTYRNTLKSVILIWLGSLGRGVVSIA